ncbi:MAG: PEP-CTERM sorting domain-containing protein [Pseudomonadota bacterium]
MKKLFSIVGAVAAMLAAQGAFAGGISDTGVNAYWGADNHGYADVIGTSLYDIDSATIARVGSVLTVTIATNFAGHAGADSWAAPGGIGYGDVFLANAWNPFGSDANHINDNAANGTKWSYGLSLDNRWSNTGGTFKLYQLNGASNAANINNSETFLSCQIGTQCYYRNGQATAVNTASSTVQNTGVTGNWTVTADQQLKFTINVATTDLVNFASFAMHWGETCQNDVIEGVVKMVPTPGSVPLLALGLGAMVVLRRRQQHKVLPLPF